MQHYPKQACCLGLYWIQHLSQHFGLGLSTCSIIVVLLLLVGSILEENVGILFLCQLWLVVFHAATRAVSSWCDSVVDHYLWLQPTLLLCTSQRTQQKENVSHIVLGFRIGSSSTVWDSYLSLQLLEKQEKTVPTPPPNPLFMPNYSRVGKGLWHVVF